MDGIILIDKSAGISSFRAISILKRKLNLHKVGHCGTLDPFATGLMVVTVNKATKINQFLVNEDKEYIATLKLGTATDTLDLEGEVIKSASISPFKREDIERVFTDLCGEQMQVPPMYSAVKVNGKRLYDLARKDIEVERTPRPISIYKLELIEYNDDTITFSVHCSKGTYIRVLGEQIAEALNNVGHLIALRRTKIGPFELSNAASLQDIENNKVTLLPSIIGLNHLAKIVVDGCKINDVKDGKPFEIDSTEEMLLFIDTDNNCLAVYQRTENNTYRVLRGLW